ncbi:MAG TPA: hypothetical protein VFD87_00235 [Phototrophicaceae bacterium]|nr:hypothetical protein [Phototrophicaceae bacterium]
MLESSGISVVLEEPNTDEDTQPEKMAVRVEAERKGGLKGGKARAVYLGRFTMK